MYSKIFIIIVFVFGSIKALAQTDSIAPLVNSVDVLAKDTIFFSETKIDSLLISPKKTNDAIRIVDAFAYTIASPARWEKKDWLRFGGSILATSVLSLADRSVNEFTRKNHSGYPKEFADFGYHNGKPYAAFAIAGGFYATGWLINDEWTRETGVALTTAYLTSGVLQSALKKMVGRARPTEGLGPYEFRPFKNDPGFSSFPSGHTQIAFVTAMVLADRVEQPWLKVAFYSGAALTLTSRMYANAHWLSDVTFGGFLAYICTKKVMERLNDNKYQNPWEGYTKKKITWNVVPAPNGLGVVGSF